MKRGKKTGTCLPTVFQVAVSMSVEARSRFGRRREVVA